MSTQDFDKPTRKLNREVPVEIEIELAVLRGKLTFFIVVVY